MRAEGWKTHDDYTEVVTTLHVLIDEEIALQEKIHTFLELAYDAIEKNFHMWLDHLLFWGIWSDQPLAASFAKIILGRTEMQMHKTT
eukprot:1403253-Ditylum_brightwellii.AAC.1